MNFVETQCCLLFHAQTQQGLLETFWPFVILDKHDMFKGPIPNENVSFPLLRGNKNKDLCWSRTNKCYNFGLVSPDPRPLTRVFFYFRRNPNKPQWPARDTGPVPQPHNGD